MISVKRAHLNGSTNLYREAAKNNAQEMISEGFPNANIFVERPVDNDSTNKLKRKFQRPAPSVIKTQILKWKL
ncbi:9636_t:CDS:2 [Funneliformis geosporum]|uniref:14213_t:CDS:1 n=1 Tax=Funneliformis geosporum TaxID=1117311 RepID=A0A9W4SJ77_9GLOM|nr:9636_t:CDS:2 [Funneliformis geosporum]CAI2171475.1 14213_t:CDS:2 [Funneliformis geosporum]